MLMGPVADRNVGDAYVNGCGSSMCSSTDVDGAIHEAQRCIVEALDLDGSTLFERSDDGDLLGTHGWWRPEVPAPPARVSAREQLPVDAREAPGRRVGVPLEPRRAAGRGRPREPASLRPQVDRRGPAVGGAADRRRRELRRDAQRAAVASGDSSAPAPRGEHVRQRARPPAQRRGAPPGARRSGAPERSAARGERATCAAKPKARSAPPSVGQSAAIRRVQEQVRQVAETDATVLLLGETGSGKEVFASQIHELSRRRGRAMVRVNCAAIPATLIESELFGREKGAYTGALSRQIGRFELADGSTIFLDEIGDLPLRRPGQAPARAGGQADRAAGQLEGHEGRHANHRRDASGSRETD